MVNPLAFNDFPSWHPCNRLKDALDFSNHRSSVSLQTSKPRIATGALRQAGPHGLFSNRARDRSSRMVPSDRLRQEFAVLHGEELVSTIRAHPYYCRFRIASRFLGQLACGSDGSIASGFGWTRIPIIAVFVGV